MAGLWQVCVRSVSGLCQVDELPANHRASQYALQARGMAIALSDELQESVGPGTNRFVRALRAVRAVLGRPVEWRFS